MIEPKQSPQGANSLKWMVGVVLAIIVVAWLSSLGDQKTATDSTSSPSSTGTNLKPQSGENTPAPVSPLPLDKSAAQRGYAQFRLVAASHVSGGSEIYSENCYAALRQPFDWHQLDRCGAYDALAVRWTEQNDSVAGNDDLTYFQSEAAATRFLRTATSAGLAADQADQRWATLQKMALHVRIPTSAPLAAGSSSVDDGVSDEDNATVKNSTDDANDANVVDPPL